MLNLNTALLTPSKHSSVALTPLPNMVRNNKDAKNVHWTLGGPYFEEYARSDYADEWFDIYYDTIKIDLL